MPRRLLLGPCRDEHVSHQEERISKNLLGEQPSPSPQVSGQASTLSISDLLDFTLDFESGRAAEAGKLPSNASGNSATGKETETVSAPAWLLGIIDSAASSRNACSTGDTGKAPLPCEREDLISARSAHPSAAEPLEAHAPESAPNLASALCPQRDSDPSQCGMLPAGAQEASIPVQAGCGHDADALVVRARRCSWSWSSPASGVQRAGHDALGTQEDLSSSLDKVPLPQGERENTGSSKSAHPALPAEPSADAGALEAEHVATDQHTLWSPFRIARLDVMDVPDLASAWCPRLKSDPSRSETPPDEGQVAWISGDAAAIKSQSCSSSSTAAGVHRAGQDANRATDTPLPAVHKVPGEAVDRQSMGVADSLAAELPLSLGKEGTCESAAVAAESTDVAHELAVAPKLGTLRPLQLESRSSVRGLPPAGAQMASIPGHARGALVHNDMDRRMHDFCAPGEDADAVTPRCCSSTAAAPGAQRSGQDAQEVPDETPMSYRVFFTRNAHKKRRNFEEGVLCVKREKATLYNEDGMEVRLGRTLRIKDELRPGAEIRLGGHIILEICGPIESDCV